MDYKQLAGNVSTAFLSQGVSFAVSAATSLLVPKVLGVEEYGYWQLFVFYSTYTGLFHLGVNDGVYLINGGRRREELNAPSISSQFRLALGIELAVSALIVAAVLLGSFGEERSFVVAAVGVYMPIFCASGYLGYVFQAANETKLYSYSVMVDRLLFLLPLAALLTLRVDSFEPYVVFFCAGKTCALLYCLWNARDILSANWLGVSDAAKEAVASMRVGIKLLVANLADLFVLGVVRAFIDAEWGIEVFGEVSLSLSLVNFFVTFVTQGAMVLFPALRQSAPEELGRFYTAMRDTMEIGFPAVYVLYFPMAWLVAAWLPQYVGSMRYLAILLPVCVFNGKQSICSTTYLKVLRKERCLLWLNLGTVTLSAALSLAGVYVLRSVEFALVGVVIAVIARSLASELLINRLLCAPSSGMPFEEVGLTTLFVCLSLFLPWWVALPGYVAAYALYLIANRSTAQALVRRAGLLSRGRRKS